MVKMAICILSEALGHSLAGVIALLLYSCITIAALERHGIAFVTGGG